MTKRTYHKSIFLHVSLTLLTLKEFNTKPDNENDPNRIEYPVSVGSGGEIISQTFRAINFNNLSPGTIFVSIV